MNNKIKRIQKNPNSKRKNNSNANVWEIMTAWGNLFLAFFTFLLVFLGGITAFLLYGQLREMQADARIDQRAWVIPFEFTAMKNELHQTYFEIHYKNIGKTPALETRIIAVIVDHTKEEGLDVEPFASNENGVLATDVVFTCKSKPYDGDILESIKQERIPLLFGTIWYRDIFGGKHRTKFSYSIGEDFSLAPMGPHNKVEDESQN